ncbi:MAG: hypothetical protein WDW38_000975 [Sanguina aurantia]
MASLKIGRLVPAKAALFVCDIQERFRPIITGYPTVIDTAKRMIRAAGILKIPVVVTEQYPQRLGSTVSELTEVLPPATFTVSKTCFSMLTPEVEKWLVERPNVKQVLLLGIETHVCVLQSSLDLIEKGYEVHLLVDGISSQRAFDRAAGLQRLAQAGAFTCSSEMALFQLMGDSKHPDFKAISALVQEPRGAPITASML